jgi:hypothetical protein
MSLREGQALIHVRHGMMQALVVSDGILRSSAVGSSGASKMRSQVLTRQFLSPPRRPRADVLS